MGRKVLRAAATGLMALSALSALGAAATADTELPTTARVEVDSSGVLRYTGTAGDDKVGIDVAASSIEVQHFASGGVPAAIEAGPGCVQLNQTIAKCGAYTANSTFRAVLGPGSDVVVTSVPLRGNIDAGGGDDRWRRLDIPGAGIPRSSMLFNGGEGLDVADYTAVRDVTLSVTIDDIANDGAPGETDNITRSVEWATLPKP